MRIGIVIVAGGSGTRSGAGIPKQYIPVGDKTILQHGVDRLRAFMPDAPIVIVIGETHHHHLSDIPVHDTCIIIGGATRQASVSAGLNALQHQGITHVMIHDAARPFVDLATCKRLLHALTNAHAVIPVLPVTDTIKRVDITTHHVLHTLDRTELVTVQTPQAFHYDTLCSVHQRALNEGWDIATDDAGLCEKAGVDVATVQGAKTMFKITTPEDVTAAKIFVAQEHMKNTRVGFGYDVHRLHPHEGENKQGVITLGGIAIPHTYYLEGHSDADVVLHALTDAILGAIGQGDIGQHFPPSDAAFRHMDSAHFVRYACALMQQMGGILVNADLTIVGEHPKIAPYRDVMRVRIAEIIGVDVERVNIKATTTERLGFEGRGEGLAAHAIVSIAFSLFKDSLM
jgi:2-C-methyl-D-erythritol 4-phosphate cytidylyltransferase / 2-C-methyl-D-erythritol 2,4-cyclodiphosphate synthase